MNQALKDLWKKNFPLWPDVLIEKFSNQIEIEANFFDNAYGSDAQKFFDFSIKSVNRNYVVELFGNFNTRQFGQVTLFNPSNPKFYKQQTYEYPPRYLYVGICPENELGNQNGPWNYPFAGGPFQKNTFIFSFTGIWDNRLFGDFSISQKIAAVQIGAPFMASYLSIMSYDSMRVVPIKYVFSVSLDNAAKKYAQSDSLIALHENGVDMPGIDYAKLYEFNTYLKAYQNYGAQIQGAADVAKKTAAADILNYKSDLDSKLLAQKNNLQNLTLQLTSQTAAEAASAKRDMQQLSLQVATIKLQIMGLVK